ncbi:electron transfer flavoprotein-ubiquinone oxidoreductase [Kushneria aurantia]|uniref:Electron transfer flavoprotein-ubiquinone oxidoreductase n=1 Tax=Kushneria aurantia TaxID=504092 RepID=A0ABV6G6W3_9GAMM|nr:electron transfer flavoprotein-ubiquinone oxidoreductase [Kushneria aurantia]
MDRESMSFDVVIVGAGVAGLSAACRLMQYAAEQQRELSVCVLEKGAEVGAHILSGAAFDPSALNRLFPDWHQRGAPLHVAASQDEILYLRDSRRALRFPEALVPPSMLNRGSYLISAADLCRWLAEQAEALGVDIFPGFPAQQLMFGEQGQVTGVITGDMGLDRAGNEKAGFEPGIELHGRYTLFAEGSRGHLGKQLIERFDLAAGRDPQHYAIGLKELWQVPEENHQPGLVIHSAGWPLGRNTQGGSFLYHGAERQVMVGLIVDLAYDNPWLSPFDEFQRLKHHPTLAQHLAGGERLAFGARSITKGGLNSLPEMVFPGGLLIGCDAGTLDFSRIKGLHSAMGSAMDAAETVAEALTAGDAGGQRLTAFNERFRAGETYAELARQRNFGPAMHRFGMLGGGAWSWLDQKLGGRLPRLRDPQPDHQRLRPASDMPKIDYPHPDGVLSFDKPSSVYLSNTNHEENQPCHLRLENERVPIEVNLPRYAEPAQRYCPVSVYEIEEHSDGPVFRINFQNCIHCKTCDIKDPSQNIRWVPPEGGGGPGYPNM